MDSKGYLSGVGGNREEERSEREWPANREPLG